MILDIEAKIAELWTAKYKTLVNERQYPKNIELVKHRYFDAQWDLRRGETQIGGFNLKEMACANALVSSGVWMADGYKNRGIGKILNALRVEAAGEMMLLCTVNNTNVAQIKILLGNGWRRLKGVDSASSLWSHGGVE